jgi:photosystem II stability/assembly factor-like uncharacterized protein
MNKLIKLFLLLTIFSTIFNLNAFSQGFYSVYSKDGNDVIAVGNNGIFFRSNDGGNTWGSASLGSTTLNSVFAINLKIWVAGNNGSLAYSSNNGAGWTIYNISSSNLKSVFFIDENTGWVVGTAGAILKTTNSGVNWTTQTSSTTQNLNSVKFTSSTNGVACGAGGTVIYTSNGGSTWQQYTIPTTKELLSVDQKSSTVIASAVDGIVIKSTNSGSAWSTIDYKIVTKSDVRSVYMMDPNTYFSCGGGGFIRKSTDGGNTFTFQKNPMMANLVCIYFSNSTNGWAVSSLNNAVIRTTDGGNTWSLPAGTTIATSWTLKQSGSNNIGNDFCLHPTDKKAIFVCMGKVIYRSGDVGETWTQTATVNTTFSSAHSFYISPKDTAKMLVEISSGVGSSSHKLMRTTDYGASWTDVLGTYTGTSYGMPLEMDQNHPDTIFLGPDGGVLMRSTDFGATWANWGTFTFRSPCDFAVVWYNSNIMYCDDGITGSGQGQFLKSTDNGVTWTSVHYASGTEMPMIATSSLDPNLAYHTCWSSGGYWRTNDQWATFTMVLSAGSLWGADIAKDDPTATGTFIYGSTGYISTDGGNNFTSTNVVGSPDYGVLYYDKGTLLCQQGGGIYKLTVTYTVLTANNQISSLVPKDFKLLQNYPNPFNPTTMINYDVKKQSFIQIKVYNILGQEVRSLINSDLGPGSYNIRFDGSGLSSGVYFYSLLSDGQRLDTKKFVLNK